MVGSRVRGIGNVFLPSAGSREQKTVPLLSPTVADVTSCALASVVAILCLGVIREVLPV